MFEKRKGGDNREVENMYVQKSQRVDANKAEVEVKVEVVVQGTKCVRQRLEPQNARDTKAKSRNE